MRLVVTGKAGQVAQALSERGRDQAVEIVCVGRPDMDLEMPETIAPALAAAKPDLVVSAAAWTDVDRAESEPERAWAVNAAGAGAVSAAARSLGVPVLHLSTDYVFDGTPGRPWRESDEIAPLTVYGSTKADGERLVAEANPDHLILRTAWVYSAFGFNFVRTMLRLGASNRLVRVVDDQRGNPTAAHDIAAAIIELAGALSKGGMPARRTYHLAGASTASWAEFAVAIFIESARLGRPLVRVEPITTDEFPRPAPRPLNSMLDCSALLNDFGIRLPGFRRSLRPVVDRILAREFQP